MSELSRPLSTDVGSRLPGLAGRMVSSDSCRKRAFGRFAEGRPCHRVAEVRTGPGVDRPLPDIQWEGEKVDRRSAGSQVAARAARQVAGLRLVELVERPLGVGAHPRPCAPAPPPFCEPSILCGSP